MFRFLRARKTEHPAPGIAYLDMSFDCHNRAEAEIYHPQFLMPINNQQIGYTFPAVNPPSPVQPPPAYIAMPAVPTTAPAGQVVSSLQFTPLQYQEGETNPSY